MRNTIAHSLPFCSLRFWFLFFRSAAASPPQSYFDTRLKLRRNFSPSSLLWGATWAWSCTTVCACETPATPAVAAASPPQSYFETRLMWRRNFSPSSLLFPQRGAEGPGHTCVLYTCAGRPAPPPPTGHGTGHLLTNRSVAVVSGQCRSSWRRSAAYSPGLTAAPEGSDSTGPGLTAAPVRPEACGCYGGGGWRHIR